MSSNGVLWWLRRDLRLRDNPALAEAVSFARERGASLIPVFVWSPEEESPWAPGAASRWWLAQSLGALSEELKQKNSRLILRAGESVAELERLADETRAIGLFWNKRFEPKILARDARVRAHFERRGLRVREFNGALLREPWELKTKTGTPYQVFTPFWKAFVGLGDPAEPLPAPTKIPAPARWPATQKVEELKLEPGIPWDAGLREHWSVGEAAARKELKRFLRDNVDGYGETRNLPAVRGTSRMSPYLHFGEISPREIWHEIYRQPRLSGGAATYLKEIGWREFAHHLLCHFPQTDRIPLREKFAEFPWAKKREFLPEWQRGLTGYPIVDAGMRELWANGWMHNRVRMIVASFLVKHLRIHWLEGAEWFWDTLVDADLANNSLNWQWSAGCGADAAPYFRVFNPVTQGEKFDPDGTYVRRWIPELEGVPDKFIHRPWEMKLPKGHPYPPPVVDHAEARDRALAAFFSLKKAKT